MFRWGPAVHAAQSVEGLHDDHAERTRLLNSASTLVAHRRADPDPVVARAGSIRRPERSHQLDPTGATGMGSLGPDRPPTTSGRCLLVSPIS